MCKLFMGVQHSQRIQKAKEGRKEKGLTCIYNRGRGNAIHGAKAMRRKNKSRGTGGSTHVPGRKETAILKDYLLGKREVKKPTKGREKGKP